MKLSASPPAVVCIAGFEVASSRAGAVYAMVTVCPTPIVEERVSVAWVPLTETPVTGTGTPFLVTANALAADGTEPNSVEKSKVTESPSTETAAEVNLGPGFA